MTDLRPPGRVSAMLAWIRSWVQHLVSAGRVAVSGVRDPGALREVTRLTLLAAERDRNRLPEAYRAFFQPGPLPDETLAVHREADLERLATSVASWVRGECVGIQIWTGPPGCGRSTFLKLAQSALSVDHRVVRLVLPGRINESADVARLIGATLFPGDSEPTSFDDLIRLLGDREDRTLVCLIDHLEWLALRAPGGQNLLEQFLRFMSTTDNRVCWVATMNELSWRFLTRTRPTSAALARVEKLTPWDRSGLEALVMRRHERGGGTLLFLESDNPAERLERGPEQSADMRAERYFTLLTSGVGQSPGQALFDWTRSCEPDHHPDERAIRPYRPLSYAFLSGLDDMRAFVLRACLVHGRLSATDLSRILRIDRADAGALLYSLADLALLKREADGAWHLVSPVVSPVNSYLRDRNFV